MLMYPTRRSSTCLEKPYEQNNSRKSSSRNSDYGNCVKYHQRVHQRTAKSTGTATKSASDAAKTLRTRRASTRTKTPASTTKTASKSTTQTSVQQDNTMSQNTVRRVAIIGGNRIPFARSNGAYFTASNTDMFTAALNGLG